MDVVRGPERHSRLQSLTLLRFLRLLRLRPDVNNLEITCGIEDTVLGQAVDMEELIDQKLNPPARETGNLDTLPMLDYLAVGHGSQEFDQRRSLIIIEIVG